MTNINPEKHDRFIKIAEQRTNKILKTLKLLGNCANKGNYSYTEEEVRKIFTAIERELRNTRNKFQEQQQDEIEFKF
ncbi:hypothetical protein BABA_10536 [Neobacillus bataviensis LMG 21833]|uniref:Histidine kinase n=1 Tax=Neobacillus bataviensis LMG 21833 TaxID=1117379 RepID=K6DM93_9BACI|nr:hypothetical protein [Neobacillus bataviensis]EKN69293.1 hypothetical protein BABA_10536 [Neobacillus bataviensis LMG 21833]